MTIAQAKASKGPERTIPARHPPHITPASPPAPARPRAQPYARRSRRKERATALVGALHHLARLSRAVTPTLAATAAQTLRGQRTYVCHNRRSASRPCRYIGARSPVHISARIRRRAPPALSRLLRPRARVVGRASLARPKPDSGYHHGRRAARLLLLSLSPSPYWRPNGGPAKSAQGSVP